MRSVTIVLVVSAVVCTSLLCGCGSKTSQGNGPGKVIEDFYQSLFNEDYAGAYDMLSSSAKEMISYDEFKKGLEESNQQGPIDRNMQVEIISEEIDGDTATVRASLQGSEGDISMVRENGAWKITGQTP